MKCFLFPIRFRIRIVIPAVILLSIPLFSQAQTFIGVSSTPADNGAQAGPTAVITPPATAAAGDLVVIYAHYRNTGVTLNMSATGGQIWTNETTVSGDNQTFNIFWCRFNGTWAANPSITAGVGNTNALTATMYVFRPTSAANSWAIHADAVNTTSGVNNDNTITGYNTTVANTVTMAFWCNAAATTWTDFNGGGWSKAGLANQYRNTTGADQSHTSAYNIRTTAGAVNNVRHDQTVATANARRSILTWQEITPPANDLCANVISLTSTPAPTCNNTSGTLTGATYSTIASLGCGPADVNDVWYSFVAQTTNPTIALSSAPANSRVQLFSGSCSSTPLATCATGSSFTPTGLTIGQTYYARVYSTSNTAGTFNICITDPAPVNDLCTGATALASGTTCVNTTGTMYAATLSASPSTACGTATSDVWYSFVAQVTNPTISLGSIGSNFLSTGLQLFSGTCATPVSVACGTTSITASALTVGDTYFIRVFSTAPPPSALANTGFTICVTNPPPANDICANAITLTSGISCINTAGTVIGASFSGLVPGSGTCGGTVLYDVWYRFTAQTTNPVITLGSVGANFNTPKIQLLSGPCGGMSIMGCITGTTYSASGLTIGDTYYVRLFSTSGTVPATNAAFTICVTDPLQNDNCTGATTLAVTNTCAKTIGTLVNATISGVAAPAPCTGTVGPDVWYRFVATAAATTITIGDFGGNFGATRRFQLFTGSCGTLSSVACFTGTGGTVSTNTTLVPGTTYYLRVFSTNAAAPTSNGDFTICVFATPSAQRIGNSYVNITKQTTGGVVEPGDILEIRMAVNHTAGTIDRLRYVDNVPNNTTMLTHAEGNRLRVLSNEGIVVEEFTLAPDADGGTYRAVPGAGEYNVRMNLNFNGTTNPPSPAAPGDNTDAVGTANGQLTAGNVPNVWGSTLFATAFRVRVTGPIGSVITLGTGKFLYRSGASNPELSTTPYQILISSPMSLCANSTGVNMSEEFGGTFGTGTTLNRPTNLSTPIPGYDFVQSSSFQSVGDRQYSIVKNLSPRSGTNTNAERSPSQAILFPNPLSYQYRMHDGHWDIDGDHTGSTTNVGNAPLGESISGGYMLMVNADFVASETYRQTLNNLCPNTYYEFSAWFKNICPTCGNNYETGTNYSPREPGVKPNLTFTLDGLDRYSTGEIPYYSSGTTANGWVKKGFVFVTGPSQTSATLSIRNNSQGGGGNDWAMDDITVATCLPSMTYTPTLNPTVCQLNPITINNTVRSYFSNYNHYKWQRSTDGGTNWSDIAGQTGSATPVLVSGQWEYPTSYVVPPTNTTLVNNGDRYRLIVATTAANLSGSTCQVTDGISQVNLSVQSCTPALRNDILSFNGKLVNKKVTLSWTTTREDEPFQFFVERSFDGNSFTRVGLVQSYNNQSAETNHYTFIDSMPVVGITTYRIVMSSNTGVKKYSRTIQLLTQGEAFKVDVINPFSRTLSFSITSIKDEKVDVLLLNTSGNAIKQKSYFTYMGLNNYIIENTESLPSGVYILQVKSKEASISKKLIKK